MTNRSISETELRIAELVAQGWQDKRIADELGVSHDSARQRLHALSQKIGASNRTMVAVWYLQRKSSHGR